MSAPRSNPRQAACEALLRIEKSGEYADRLIDSELLVGSLTGPDRGLFAELVFGVLRRQGTIDHILAQFLDKPLGELDRSIHTILRIGLYQLMYLDRIPESAAVNESVNLARQTAPRLSGLVNAVLRTYLRQRAAISFPDPESDPAQSMAARHSHPVWLVEMWIAQLGTAEAEAMAAASSLQPPLTVRANTLRTGRGQLLKMFEEADVRASACQFSTDGITVAGRPVIRDLPGYGDGLFTVQDESSQLAGMLLGSEPYERVWDACAAPGGKTVILAQQIQDRGSLVATDLSPSKLRMIDAAAGRLGITCVSTAIADLRRPETAPEGAFDRILLDAPCSGLGVIRRNPEAKWRLKHDDITRLAAAQRNFLENVAAKLKPGGALVYSTCSTSREENEDVVRDFLSRHGDFVLENISELFPGLPEFITVDGFFRAWPHRHGTDGFFAARMKKIN